MHIPSLQEIKNRVPFFPKNCQCPVCESRFHSYLPLPAQYEASWKKYGFPYTINDFETLNAAAFSCPACGATDRDRLFAVYLSGLVKSMGAGSSFLDIAPGQALSKWIRANCKGRYITCDLFMPGVDVVADIQDMNPFQADEFDLILCSHVLEHVPDDRKALSELYRVLRKGGQLLLLVPVVTRLSEVIEDPSLTDIPSRWKQFGQDDHIRLYSAKGFAERITEAGFTLERFSAAALNVNFSKSGFQENAVLYIARK
jgi:SAM-dependent methyltransferase